MPRLPPVSMTKKCKDAEGYQTDGNGPLTLKGLKRHERPKVWGPANAWAGDTDEG
jgi:hypothetical protein